MKGTGDVIDPPNELASVGVVSAGRVGTTAAGSEIVGPFLMQSKQMGTPQQRTPQPPHILGKGTVDDRGDNDFNPPHSPLPPWAAPDRPGLWPHQILFLSSY